MNCRSAEHLFSSFVEDELSQRERRALEGHLEECSHCSTAVEELRTTVDLLSALPSYETGPAFEEEVMDRIRSGEALRPSLIEWLSEHLAPARLRPVFLAGAAGCAIWIAVLIANPMRHFGPGSESPELARTTPPAGTVAAPPASEPSTPSSMGSPSAPAAPAGDVVASATQTRRDAPEAGPATLASETADSARANDAAPYQDEYILDQFYLNRSGEDGVHSIVPVTGRQSDGVYIIF